MNLRRVEVNDLMQLLTCNLHNMPENYYIGYWERIILRWPDLSYLAEDDSGKVVGYTLATIEPEDGQTLDIGHIFSLSILRPYRRLGLAQRLMNLSMDAIIRNAPDIDCIQLHVRKSNKAARSLYNKLGYRFYRNEFKYYEDEEDALVMRRPYRSENPEQRGRPSSDTEKFWNTKLWNFVRNRPRRLAEATMSLLRRQNSLP